MSPTEFELFLRERLQADTASLVEAARRHYLAAAALLEVRSPTVERLEDPAWNEGVQLWMAFRAVETFQKRYATNLYTPQIGFWDGVEEGQDVQWVKYLHHELKPALLQRQDFVRALLRCVGLMTSASATDSEIALSVFAREMAMPRIPDTSLESATPAT
jgi:hypothetical protein